MNQLGEGKMVADFLNYNIGTPIYLRIVELIQEIQKARKATPLVPSLLEFFRTEAKGHFVPAVSWNDIRRLNAKLRNYMSWPRIVGRRKIGGRSKDRQHQSRLIWQWWSQRSVGPVVYAVVKLEQEGQFEYLHLCEMCNEKWFFTTRGQRFCSMTCREKNYRTTDEGRRMRRDYMRRYRAQPSELQKKRIVRAKLKK